MRFTAPPRCDVSVERFEHPLFAELAPWARWLRRSDWPSLDEINRELVARTAGSAGSGRSPVQLVEQTPDLTRDRLHFEVRIRERGQIATRIGCWHDLFNALVWLAQPAIKRALNARQANDVLLAGPSQRTRAQCALTHFDEAGVVLILREADRLSRWDRHDWQGLFHGLATDDYAVVIVGHALYEHGLVEGKLVVGKALAVIDPTPRASAPEVASRIAEAIENKTALTDPQQLRPLPLMGLPGWHPRSQEPEFLREADCFRPLREGRVYPAPFGVQADVRSAVNEAV